MAKNTIFFVISAYAMAAIILLALPIESTEEELGIREDAQPTASSPPSFRGIGRLLAGHSTLRRSMTCDVFPRVCRAAGSPGPDCCRKQCVDVTTDSRNCGRCGLRCRYGEACCSGECVNVVYDGKNCGGCKKRCKKGSFCKYGMCSYA